MILLNILKKKKIVKNLLVAKEYKSRLLSFNNKLKGLKTNKNFDIIHTQNSISDKIYKNILSRKTSNDYINYIINVNLTPTNTIINVTDIKGNVMFSISSGSINLTSRQKKQQPLALVNLFKVLIVKAKFLKNKPIALHFKNTKSFYETLIINLLQNKYYIVSVQSCNLSPHNGCRPKKLRRTKIRTKRKVLR